MFGAWKDEILLAVGNLNFAQFARRPFQDAEKYPAFVVSAISDAYTSKSEEGSAREFNRNTEIYVLVKITDRDIDAAEEKAERLADDVMTAMDLHFEYRLNWVAREPFTFAIGANDVQAIRLEFNKEFVE